MAYYTALINAWNSATQPPVGVTGTGLTGLTTEQKIAAINGWTVTGTVPTSLLVTGSQLLNCINWTEFAALTAPQQSNLLALCQVPGQLQGGSGETSFMADGMILAYLPDACDDLQWHLQQLDGRSHVDDVRRDRVRGRRQRHDQRADRYGRLCVA